MLIRPCSPPLQYYFLKVILTTLLVGKSSCRVKLVIQHEARTHQFRSPGEAWTGRTGTQNVPLASNMRMFLHQHHTHTHTHLVPAGSKKEAFQAASERAAVPNAAVTSGKRLAHAGVPAANCMLGSDCGWGEPERTVRCEQEPDSSSLAA